MEVLLRFKKRWISKFTIMAGLLYTMEHPMETKNSSAIPRTRKNYSIRVRQRGTFIKMLQVEKVMPV